MWNPALFKSEQRAFRLFSSMASGRRGRTILTALGGSGNICLLVVLSIFAKILGTVIQATMQKDIVHLLRRRARVLQFSALLLGLTLYSYSVRDLLVCWLFFCLFFAALVSLLLGALLACYAGKQLTERVFAMAWGTPKLPLKPATVHQEIRLERGITLFPTCEVAAVSQLPLGMLEPHPHLLLPAATTVEASVQK